MELSDLPDDVVSQTIKHVPSLCDKFKLAALSQQFRRCVFKELKTPRPLVIDFPGGQLNGHRIPIDRWSTAVQVLAKQAQLSKIVINVSEYEDSRGWYKKTRLSVGVLEAICQSPECLGRLTTIEHDKVTSYESQSIAQIIQYSPKISTLKLIASSCSCSTSPLPSISASLKNQRLVEIDISGDDQTGIDITAEEVVEFLQAATSDTLKTVRVMGQWDPTQILTALSTSRVEIIELCKPAWCFPKPSLFELITRMSALKKCTLDLHWNRYQPVADCVAAYFSNIKVDPKMKREVELVWEGQGARQLPDMCGCEVIDLIQSIQHKVPGVKFGINTSVTRHSGPRSVLRFSKKNAAVAISNIGVTSGHNTVACKSFYGNLLKSLVATTIYSSPNTHLDHCLLDRCKINRLVDDLNQMLHDNWRALSVVPNEAQTNVTVTFEHKDGQCLCDVDIEHCFVTGCPGCLEI